MVKASRLGDTLMEHGYNKVTKFIYNDLEQGTKGDVPNKFND